MDDLVCEYGFKHEPNENLKKDIEEIEKELPLLKSYDNLEDLFKDSDDEEIPE